MFAQEDRRQRRECRGHVRAALWLSGLICLLILVQGACASEEATQRVAALLGRMTEALRSLSYEGTLVYLHDDQLEALNLVHRVADGRVQERLVSLSGPVRAVLREEDRVMCVLPDGHPISAQRYPGGGVLDTAGLDPGRLGDHYRVEMLGTSRVAGRDTDVVGIIPRDALRYGYRFHIDRATGLPLQSDLIDQTERSLEQLMFTTIALQPSDGSLPAVATANAVRDAPATEPSSRWRFDDRPEGFQLVMHHLMNDPKGTAVEHFLFTDRLSAYSIYIEADTQDGLEGTTRIGAVHAAGRTVGGHQVTAVGEVPSETVEAAIAGARLLPDSAR